MSVRIHQLSKQIGIDNKELIALLQERGYSVKSASSTIDNISAESIVEEFKTREEPSEPDVAEPEGAEAAAEEPVEADPAIKLPPNVFVKSAEEVQREREERAAALEAAKRAAAPQPKTVEPPAPPQPPPPPRPPAPPQQPSAPPARSPGTPPPVAPPARKAPPVVPPRPAAVAPKQPDPKQQEPQPEHPAKEVPAAAAALEMAEGEAQPDDDSDIKVIVVKPPIVVRDFAGQLGLKPFRLISELMEMNIFASMNQVIEESVANELAVRHGFLLDVRHRGESAAKAPAREKAKPAPVDESKFLEPRPPVVCILGHVDHGKTTLLDNIRKASVVAGEAGGITQHIGAYQVEIEGGRKITFLDTPGHAAFSKMRARGANVTDIAILIVAADDGFMPQTDEALKHAQAARVPVMVAINKTDARGANVDRVKKQMQERQIASEDWGGETVTVPISALKGDGIDDLLEMIGLQAEVLELKANPQGAAEGVIVEAQVEVGRGPTATVIVQKGTLKVGDALVCGSRYCKARAMFDDAGRNVKQALPATPVRVIGWSDAPDAGSQFRAVKNEREAKALAEEKSIELRKQPEADGQAPRPSIDDLFSAIASQKKKVFRAVVRSDVQGSAEAVLGALNDINSDKVDVEIVAADVGQISQSDVLMASAANASIIGFNVKMEPGVKSLAKHHSVTIRTHNIIYELIDDVKVQMAELLDPDIKETKLGAAQVRQVFPMARGAVAGCLVTEGRIVRDSKVRLVRQGKAIAEGRISALKRFKDDATEVRAGYECGIQVEGVDRYEEGDIIEAFEIQKSRASL